MRSTSNWSVKKSGSTKNEKTIKKFSIIGAFNLPHCEFFIALQRYIFPLFFKCKKRKCCFTCDLWSVLTFRMNWSSPHQSTSWRLHALVWSVTRKKMYLQNAEKRGGLKKLSDQWKKKVSIIGFHPIIKSLRTSKNKNVQ